MHLVSSGVQHHLISQPAQVAVQSAANTSSTAPPANRLPHNATSQGFKPFSPSVCCLCSTTDTNIYKHFQRLHFIAHFSSSMMITSKNCVSQIACFYFSLSAPLHGEQPRCCEDRCASVSRQGGRARAHPGSGSFSPCRSTGIPFSTRQHNPRQKYCTTANCSAHPRSRYCPLHHSCS